ncbi:MAG: hypothetical protein M1820_009193 [Bogoriella megaspora]|nr:MAG: hypothetical protein M1820_009193 [Bogoriella megaspora]
MQSEPTSDSQNTSIESVAESPNTSTQYGLHEPDYPTPPPSHTRGREGSSLPNSGSQRSHSEISARSDASSSRSSVGRLSAPKTPSPSRGNRIAEYENAIATPPRNKFEGPAFEVVKSLRKPGDKTSPVAGLPNEILTHALSHLSPFDLGNVALVSHRFHTLVTTPHAWRSAFSRYFPGHQSLEYDVEGSGSEDGREAFRSEKRSFTRLTKNGSWRSEYVVRTQLLRSLARGKPVHVIAPPSAARTGQSHTANAITMYNSQLGSAVNLLHGTFGGGLNKRSSPQFVHATEENCEATKSDPSNGKADNWGLTDQFLSHSFADLYPGEAMWGLGPGELVGVPNVIDVSQPCGLAHGQGHPNGLVYYRAIDEMRGRFLAVSFARSIPEIGIPSVRSRNEAICSIWIAKSSSVPLMSDGLVGILSGSSLGIVASYSLGPDIREHRHLARGELTGRWVLSPGVPIIALAVDEHYSLKRRVQNRVWAVALNALGELFYLTKMPRRPQMKYPAQLSGDIRDIYAWDTGRSVCWNFVEPSRRVARPNPYRDEDVDGSYSPRQSWNGMCLSKEQIEAETREIEVFLEKKPKDFQKACVGWDMRRRLEVDFAGDDGNYAGENIVVLDCIADDSRAANVKRYARCKTVELEATNTSDEVLPSLASSVSTAEDSSLFGGTKTPLSEENLGAATSQNFTDGWSRRSSDTTTIRMITTEEWRTSSFSLPGFRIQQISASTLDNSTYAVLTISEDPALSSSGLSETSSPLSTPASPANVFISPSDLPGQRARLLAIGTSTGSIYLWDIRASVPRAGSHANTISPLRSIHTESPSISSLGLTALTLVHGGADGLVQAWDPLASTTSPIRTLNSRFSSRARRRLVQAQARPQGVGVNYFAAGAIALDPDASSLRGMVSLGTHLRYWSYSSTASDEHQSRKRRLRRGERHSSHSSAVGSGFLSQGRMARMKDLIAEERFERERDEEEKRKEQEQLNRRFGTELLGAGASEEEVMAYARLLSEESAQKDAAKRRESGASSAVVSTPRSEAQADDGMDDDLKEAIRLSLAENAAAREVNEGGDEDVNLNVPVRYTKARKASPRPVGVSQPTAGSSKGVEMDDLDFALQLSLAEAQSHSEMEPKDGDEEFPALSPTESPTARPGDNSNQGKGKGKGRAL